MNLRKVESLGTIILLLAMDSIAEDGPGRPVKKNATWVDWEFFKHHRPAPE